MDAKERVLVAEEFAALWHELSDKDSEIMLSKNIPAELLQFFVEHSASFVSGPVDEKTSLQLANALAAGYLLRILEERL